VSIRHKVTDDDLKYVPYRPDALSRTTWTEGTEMCHADVQLTRKLRRSSFNQISQLQGMRHVILINGGHTCLDGFADVVQGVVTVLGFEKRSSVKRVPLSRSSCRENASARYRWKSGQVDESGTDQINKLQIVRLHA
jgi:hypothetical protein